MSSVTSPRVANESASVLSTSVGSASSLLLSSEVDAGGGVGGRGGGVGVGVGVAGGDKLLVGHRQDSASLANAGSWAALTDACHKDRGMSLASATPTGLKRCSAGSLLHKTSTLCSLKAGACKDDSASSYDGYHRLGGDKEACAGPGGFTGRQWVLLCVLSLATLTSSFAICLFPPFYPRIAEEKGATASMYGFIIGTNCLTTFLVTPFIGKHLRVIGVRFAFVSGVFIGGVCCFLSGFLEYFPAGTSFVVVSIAIRVIHAAGNAGTITTTFTYTAVEFPDSVAKIFSLTRTMMNIAQLAGPIIGGALYEAGGFKLPFFIMGCIQTVMAFATFPFLPDYDESFYDKGSMKPVSFKSILSIPSVWVPFCTFIVSTLANGFLSINLEPQVLRKLGLKPVLIGVYFGLKDGANSLASPIWGFLCDRRGSVKLCLLISTLFGATSIFLLGPFPYMHIDRNLTVVGIALAISGVAFAGQQVAGVVDAMHGAVDAGFPDSASTHSMIAGIWSSFSGAGRFVSRAGTGILVDHIGFQMTAVVIFTVQIIVAVCTVLCSVVSCRRGADGVGGVADGGAPGADVLSTRTTSFTYSVVDIGDYPRMTVTQPESPAESITCKSVSIPLPRNCAIVRRLRAETYAGFPR